MTKNPTVIDKAGNKLKMYRKQQGNLYKFDKDSDSYIHVYQFPFTEGISDLITRYEIAEMCSCELGFHQRETGARKWH